jgi:hypothetical protein
MSTLSNSTRRLVKVGLSRRELNCLGIDMSSRPEAPFEGEARPRDEALLGWYSANFVKLMEFLALGEMEQPKEHTCGTVRKIPRGWTLDDCFYFSKNRHMKRSRTCPDVQEGSTFYDGDPFGRDKEPTRSVGQELASTAWLEQLDVSSPPSRRMVAVRNVGPETVDEGWEIFYQMLDVRRNWDNGANPLDGVAYGSGKFPVGIASDEAGYDGDPVKIFE